MKTCQSQSLKRAGEGEDGRGATAASPAHVSDENTSLSHSLPGCWERRHTHTHWRHTQVNTHSRHFVKVEGQTHSYPANMQPNITLKLI